MADPDQRLNAYRESVLRRHSDAFELHSETASLLETAVLEPRAHTTHVQLVLDMLMIQGLKTHAAVSLLCRHGLMEDSATMARRLLELSTQAVYIGQEDDKRLRRRKAGQYAAYLWRQIPSTVKRRLPDDVRKRWTSLGRGYGRFITRRHGWGPPFRTMFDECGHLDLYETDYSFLSSVAHGTADTQVFQFSSRDVLVHNDRFVSILLVYSTKYYMVMAEPWFGAWDIGTPSELTAIADRLRKWIPS